MEHSEESNRAVLIYDGNCPFCLKSIHWVEENSITDLIELLPCQSKELKYRFPKLNLDNCMYSMQLILPDKKILSGAEAIPEILKRLKRWRILSCLFQLPGIHWFANSVYRWIAKHRYSISCVINP